jgi:hypothetical protein
MIRKRICKTAWEMDVHSPYWRKHMYGSSSRSSVAYTKRSSNRRERREARDEIEEQVDDLTFGIDPD